MTANCWWPGHCLSFLPWGLALLPRGSPQTGCLQRPCWAGETLSSLHRGLEGSLLSYPPSKMPLLSICFLCPLPAPLSHWLIGCLNFISSLIHQKLVELTSPVKEPALVFISFSFLLFPFLFSHAEINYTLGLRVLFYQFSCSVFLLLYPLMELIYFSLNLPYHFVLFSVFCQFFPRHCCCF